MSSSKGGHHPPLHPASTPSPTPPSAKVAAVPIPINSSRSAPTSPLQVIVNPITPLAALQAISSSSSSQSSHRRIHSRSFDHTASSSLPYLDAVTEHDEEVLTATASPMTPGAMGMYELSTSAPESTTHLMHQTNVNNANANNAATTNGGGGGGRIQPMIDTRAATAASSYHHQQQLLQHHRASMSDVDSTPSIDTSSPSGNGVSGDERYIRSYSAASALDCISSPHSTKSAITQHEFDSLLSPHHGSGGVGGGASFNDRSPYPPQFFADFGGATLLTPATPPSGNSTLLDVNITSHPMGSYTPGIAGRTLIASPLATHVDHSYPYPGIGVSRRRSRAKASSGGPEAMAPLTAALQKAHRSERTMSMGMNDGGIAQSISSSSGAGSGSGSGGPILLRTLSLSSLHVPSPSLLRLRDLIRTRIFPLIRHQVVRNIFLNRMTARLAANGSSGPGGLHVWNLLGAENGLHQFRQRVQSRLSKQSTPEKRSACAEEIMSSMFRSLQTFHHLTNLQQNNNGDLSKVDALKTVLSAVYKLLDCEQVTLYLVDETGMNLKIAWSHEERSGGNTTQNNHLAVPAPTPTAASSSSASTISSSLPASSSVPTSSSTSSSSSSSTHLRKHVESILLKEKGRGIIGQVARTGQITNIMDAEKDVRYNLNIDRLTGRKTKSMLCVPVSVYNAGGKFLESGRVVAVIEATNKKRRENGSQHSPHASTTSLSGANAATSATVSSSTSTPTSPPTTISEFTEEDVSLLKFIGQLVGSTIENHSLFTETLLRKRQQEALSRMIELMSSETDINAVMLHIITTAHSLISGGVDRINLYLVDELKQHIICKISKDSQAIGQKLPIHYGILGQCASEGVIINIQDTKSDTRYDRTLDRIHNYQCNNLLTLPILDKHKHVAAIIQCTNKLTGPFTREDEELLMSLSRSAGEILRKAQLFEALLVEQRKTRALLAMCQADESSNSVDELSEKILDIVNETCSAELYAVGFVDRQSNELVCIVSQQQLQIVSNPPPLPPPVFVQPHDSSPPLHPLNPGHARQLSRSSMRRRSSVISTSATAMGNIVPTSSSASISAVGTGSPLDRSKTASGGSNATRPRSTLKRITIKLTNPNANTSIPSHVANTGLPLNISSSSSISSASSSTSSNDGDNTHNIPLLFDHIFDSTFGITSKSTLCLPMKNHTTNTTFAVLFAVNKLRPTSVSGMNVVEAFSDEDEEVLTALCQQSGSSIRRRLTEFLLERSRQNKDVDVDSMLSMYGTGTGSMPTRPPTLGAENSMPTPMRMSSSPRAPSRAGGGGGGHQLEWPSSATSSSTTTEPSSPLTRSQSVMTSPPSSVTRTPQQQQHQQRPQKSTWTPLLDSILKANKERKMTEVDAAAHAVGIEKGKPGSSSKSNVSTATTQTQTGSIVSTASVASSTSSPPTTSPTNIVIPSAISPPPHHLPPSKPDSTSPSNSRFDTEAFEVTVIPVDTTPPNASTMTTPFATQIDAAAGSSTTTTGNVDIETTTTDQLSLATAFSNHSPALRALEPSTEYDHSPRPAWARTPSELRVVRNFPPPSWSHFQPPAPPTAKSTAAASTGNNTMTADSTAEPSNVSQLPVSSPAVQEVLISSPLLRPLVKILGTGTAASSASTSMPSYMRSHSSPQRLSVPSNIDVTSGSGGVGHHAIAMRTASTNTTPDDDEPIYVRAVGVWPVHLLSSTSSPSPFQLKFDLSELRTLSFNCWNYDEDELVLIAYALLDDSGLINEFALNPQTLQSFLLHVRSRYRTNAYHNFYHAFSVLQCGYMILRETLAHSFLSGIEHLGLLIACLCHDIDHPGTTNSFQINCASDLALQHNDASVLEGHHAFVTFSLLRDPRLNIFSPQQTKLTSNDNRILRKSMILSILATDMSYHFETCKKLDQIDEFDLLSNEKENDRQFLTSLIVHAADLSGQMYPLEVAKEWERRVTEEFSHQAVLESHLGLPVAPFMQNLDSQAIRWKNHLSFIDFVMGPFVRGLVDLLTPLQPCLQNLQDNRAYFSALLQEAQDKQSKEEEEEQAKRTADADADAPTEANERENTSTNAYLDVTKSTTAATTTAT